MTAFGSDPIGVPALVVMAVSAVAFAAALIAVHRRAEREERGNATRSRRSMAGIVIQGTAIGLAGLGAQRVTLHPGSAAALAAAATCAILMMVAIGLFRWASRTMGRNWSLVARTRTDHRLVQEGPFAYVRHPIYTALFALMLALAIALGHVGHLSLSIPLFALGTWLRISEEERLLRAAFGAAYDDYARRVKRFVPGLL